MSTTIQSAKYQGHQGPVLCLDVAEEDTYGECLLLSGSEDHTARLWDTRENSARRRACLCIPTQGDVLSVAFSPALASQTNECSGDNDNREETTTMDVDMPSSNNIFAKDHTIFLSVENQVLEYDLRQATAPILTQPTRNMSPILQNQDEINQMGLMPFVPRRPPPAKGKRKGKQNNKNHSNSSASLYLAAADDAGTVRFMETQSTSSQILHHDPNGVAVVPTCVFRPSQQRGSSLELASGGTDCKINLWDLLRPKRPISSYMIKTPDNGETSKPQVCNPPMVHTLAWSATGKLLAAGLGDGNIPIFCIENRNLVQTGFLPEGHDSSVASIVFPSFANTDRMLLSGGSDGSIICWDVGANVLLGSNQGNDDPSQVFPETLLRRHNSNDPMDELSKRTGEISLGQPTILFGIHHGSKMNWMTSSRQPATVFVADTSNDITAYEIPLR